MPRRTPPNAPPFPPIPPLPVFSSRHSPALFSAILLHITGYVALGALQTLAGRPGLPACAVPKGVLSDVVDLSFTAQGDSSPARLHSGSCAAPMGLPRRPTVPEITSYCEANSLDASLIPPRFPSLGSEAGGSSALAALTACIMHTATAAVAALADADTRSTTASFQGHIQTSSLPIDLFRRPPIVVSELFDLLQVPRALSIPSRAPNGLALVLTFSLHVTKRNLFVLNRVFPLPNTQRRDTHINSR